MPVSKSYKIREVIYLSNLLLCWKTLSADYILDYNLSYTREAQKAL